MLYRIDEEGKPERFKEKEILAYRDKLKEIFPYSFDVDKPQPVSIKLADRYKKSLPRFRAKLIDVPIGRKDVGTRNLHAPSIEKVRDTNGISRQVVFSLTAPVVRFGEKWKPESINLAKKTTFDPVYDLEMLIFLFFFSCEIINGERGKTDRACVNAHFDFVMPEKVAAEGIAKIRRNREMEDYIINEGTFLSYEDLCKVAAVRGIATTGIEDKDRTTIYHILSDDTAWTGFKRVMEDIIGVRKNTADMSEINEKVNAARKAKVLGFDEKSNKWNITSTKGAIIMEVCAGVGTTDKERKFNLIEYLKKDTAAMEKLNELLPEAVAA